MTLRDQLDGLCAEIVPMDADAAAAALARHNALTKPPGSLGALEMVGCQLAGIAGTAVPPAPRRPALVIAAADHGVLAQGVSPWPAEVTAAMVRGFCNETAAASVLARHVGARVTVLDVGVASPLPRHPLLRSARVRAGTADLSQEAAMTPEQAIRALLAGAGIAEELVSQDVDLLLTGDMGIGNTTAAACLVAAFSGANARAVTGRGTGIDTGMWEHKTQIIHDALARHHPDQTDPIAVLSAVGGLEHAALVGVILAGAAARVPVLLDGVSSVAAALAAAVLAPSCRDYLVAGHRSTEPAAAIGLEALGLRPLLQLDLRLGEGTGALLALPLVQAAAAILTEMATFSEAGISPVEDQQT